MTFAWPHLLWGLTVLPALAALYAWALERRARRAVIVPDVALFAAAAAARSRWCRHMPAACFLAALAATLIGLARPVAPLPVPASQGVVVLSIDVSRSMLAEDLPPNRMEAAKMAAREFVQTLPRGFRVGLVTFSSYATTVVTPTSERARVLEAIDLLQTEFATAIGDGLLEAVWNLPGRLRPTSPGLSPGAPFGPGVPPGSVAPPGPGAPAGSLPPGVVVLLSDGQSNRGVLPMEAARIAREQQVKVYTVGIGTPEGTFLNIGGRSIWVRLDEETLRGMAEATGGEYHRTTNLAELRRVYRHLGREIGWERRPTEVTAVAAGAGLVLLVVAVSLSTLLVHRVV
ncbi:MAG: VWA domain-containing protein [Armatimonadota bacterium]|nr:VWA domain-containing protein [Armatimonadota bacterium]MDR7486835.1 VWA domain-containing protein [Armatimonadota bacterium]MDR7532970.1 VWA domain-containing protein [Armatimonadota bacterium]MDR7537553.1 VWA domain-containing protein [Armatimonadota bacterium]